LRKLLSITVLALYAATGAYAQDSQATQVFACKLKEGQTVENVMSLAEAYRAAWPSMNQEDQGAGAFVWTAFREGTPYDYILGFLNSSLPDMAAGLASYYDSGVGAGLDAQFGETGDCDSAIVLSEQVRNGVIGNTGDAEADALVEAFSCKINPGADMDDVKAATAFWNKQVAALDSKAVNQYEAYLWTVLRGGNGQADFMWVGNYPDFATWAQGSADYVTSKQGQAAQARFDKVTTCVSGLWSGFWIVPPAAGPTAP
jgi:hypothetical protein